jgi:hypothetical protein
MASNHELYDSAVRTLPISARLQLAAMILDGIAPESVLDFSETWTDEDVEEFREASSAYLLAQLAEV